MKTKQRNIIYLLLAILLLLLWEYSSQNGGRLRLFISSPSLVWEYSLEHYGQLLISFWATFLESVLGLLIAIAFSFAIMVGCFYSKRLKSLVLPIMIISQVIPLITLAPLFIMLFGVGIESKIVMSALVCFFPVFINFSNGVRLIDQNIHELMFIYGASKTQMIRRVYFPLAQPNIFAGIKIASTLAVIGAIVGEFNGADTGLGKNLFLAAKRLEPELMMSSLFLSSILGGLLYGIVIQIEKQIGKWYLK